MVVKEIEHKLKEIKKTSDGKIISYFDLRCNLVVLRDILEENDNFTEDIEDFKKYIEKYRVGMGKERSKKIKQTITDVFKNDKEIVCNENKRHLNPIINMEL